MQYMCAAICLNILAMPDKIHGPIFIAMMCKKRLGHPSPANGESIYIFILMVSIKKRLKVYKIYP